MYRETQEEVLRDGIEAWRATEPLLTCKFTFSQNGKHLCLAANVVSNTCTHLAIFDVSSERPFQASLKEPVCTILSNLIGVDWIQVIHPEYPLVALANSEHVFLWVYHTHDQIQTSQFLDVYPLEVADPIARMWNKELSSPRKHTQRLSKVTLYTLTFSTDGRALVAHRQKTNDQIIVPIPEHVFKACKISQNIDSSMDPQDQTQLQPYTRKLDTTLAPPGWEIEHINSAAYQTSPDGSSQGITVGAPDGVVRIQFSKHRENSISTNTVEVTGIPDRWRESGKCTASLQLPQPGDTTIRVIMNQLEQQFYHTSFSEGECFPAVIDKDLRTIRTDNSKNNSQEITGILS